MQEPIDGDLAARVFGLLQVVDTGAHAARVGEHTRQRLDIALLGFFQNFRKVYIGEQVMHCSKVRLGSNARTPRPKADRVHDQDWVRDWDQEPTAAATFTQALCAIILKEQCAALQLAILYVNKKCQGSSAMLRLLAMSGKAIALLCRCTRGSASGWG